MQLTYQWKENCGGSSLYLSMRWASGTSFTLTKPPSTFVVSLWRKSFLNYGIWSIMSFCTILIWRIGSRSFITIISLFWVTSKIKIVFPSLFSCYILLKNVWRILQRNVRKGKIALFTIKLWLFIFLNFTKSFTLKLWDLALTSKNYLPKLLSPK